MNNQPHGRKDKISGSELLTYMKKIFSRLEQSGDESTVRKLVDVGRNDNCPCGSGKKYKKCCARIRPEKPADDYLEQMSEAEDDKEIYKIAHRAVQEHPLNPRFSFIIAIYGLENDLQQQAREHLNRLWQLLGQDMPAELVMPLASLLQLEGAWKQAEQIMETKLAQDEIPELMLLLSILKINLGQSQEARNLIKRADEFPREVRDNNLWLGVLQEYFSSGVVGEGLKFWLKYRDKLDQLMEDREMNVEEMIKQFLQQNQLLPEKELKEGELVSHSRQLISILDQFKDFENAMQNNNLKQAEKYLEQLKGKCQPNSRFWLMLIDGYSRLQEWEQVQALTETLPEKKDLRLNSLYIRARAARNLEQIEKAIDNIQAAFQLIQTAEDLNPWPVVGEYVKLLLQAEDKDKLVSSFIDDIRFLTESGESELDIIMQGLQGSSVSEVLDVLSKLEEINFEQNIFSQEEIFVKRFFTLLLELEKKTLEGETPALEEIEQEVISTQKEGENEGYYSPLLEYAELILTGEDLTDEKQKAQIEEILNKPASFEEEVAAKYEALINFTEQNELPEIKDPRQLLNISYHQFYQTVFYLVNDREEKATEIISQSDRKSEVISLLQGQAYRFLPFEEVTEFLENSRQMIMKNLESPKPLEEKEPETESGIINNINQQPGQSPQI